MQPIALKRLEHIIKSSGDSISQTVLKVFNGDTKLLENLVAVHLNRLYHNTEEELRLFYYNKGVEVDFCVPEENLPFRCPTTSMMLRLMNAK